MDVRRNGQLNADIFSLYGGEGIAGAIAGRRKRSGTKRYRLSCKDFGLLIVESKDTGCRSQIGRCIDGYSVDDGAE